MMMYAFLCLIHAAFELLQDNILSRLPWFAIFYKAHTINVICSEPPCPLSLREVYYLPQPDKIFLKGKHKISWIGLIPCMTGESLCTFSLRNQQDQNQLHPTYSCGKKWSLDGTGAHSMHHSILSHLNNTILRYIRLLTGCSFVKQKKGYTLVQSSSDLC